MHDILRNMEESQLMELLHDLGWEAVCKIEKIATKYLEEYIKPEAAYKHCVTNEEWMKEYEP